MKNIIFFPALLSLVLLAGCATTSSSSSGNGSSTAISSGDSPEGVLHIEYIENQPRIRATRYNSMNNETDRFYYLESNFKKVFEKKLSNRVLDFQLFPGNFTEGEPVLVLNFISLDSPSRIELELRIWAVLKIGDEEKDFGITLSRTVPQRPASSSSIERDLDEIYTEAAKEIVKMVAEEL